MSARAVLSRIHRLLGLPSAIALACAVLSLSACGTAPGNGDAGSVDSDGGVADTDAGTSGADAGGTECVPANGECGNGLTCCAGNCTAINDPQGGPPQERCCAPAFAACSAAIPCCVDPIEPTMCNEQGACQPFQFPPPP